MSRGGIAAEQARQHLARMRATEPPQGAQVATCIRAWFDLSTERAIGMAVGPIPWSRIVNWCEFHDLDHEATMLIINVIRQLDNDRATEEAEERTRKAATGGRR